MFGKDLESILESLFNDTDDSFLGEVKIIRKGIFRPGILSSCCVYNYAGYDD